MELDGTERTRVRRRRPPSRDMGLGCWTRWRRNNRWGIKGERSKNDNGLFLLSSVKFSLKIISLSPDLFLLLGVGARCFLLPFISISRHYLIDEPYFTQFIHFVFFGLTSPLSTFTFDIFHTKRPYHDRQLFTTYKILSKIRHSLSYSFSCWCLWIALSDSVYSLALFFHFRAEWNTVSGRMYKSVLARDVVWTRGMAIKGSRRQEQLSFSSVHQPIKSMYLVGTRLAVTCYMSQSLCET